MTKKINNIELLSDGGVNPTTNIHEEKLWKILFDDADTRLLGRHQMIHYLSKGTVPAKTVHSFNGHKNEMEEIKEKHTSPTNPVLFTEKVTTVEEKQEVEEFRNKVINEVGNNDNPNFYSNEKISV